MAGIGFQLRRLADRDDLLGPIASMGHAAIVAAGPWLYTVMTIVLIGESAGPVVGEAGIATFRVIVVYAFGLSLVATAPVVMIATRVLADDIYARRYDDVRSLLVAALILGSVATVLVSLCVLALMLRAPLATVVVGVACSQIVGMVWVSLAFCGAVRDYWQITLGFLVGLTIAVLVSIGGAASGWGPREMVWGFNGGLLVIFVWLTARLALTFPAPCRSAVAPVRCLLARSWGHLALGVGALASVLGVWVDKWIVWGSELGERVEGGLVHAPLYDTPMFIASLAIIPSLALFVSTLETTFFDLYRGYFQSIEAHATLNRIRWRARILERDTNRAIMRIVIMQATLCAIVVLSAPVIVSTFGLQFHQTTILRFGAIGALFQFLFLACSSLLLFFNRTLLYFALQMAFLAMSASFTWISIRLGADFIGMGYMFSAFCCGVISLAILNDVMRDLEYFTFVVGASQKPTS